MGFHFLTRHRQFQSWHPIRIGGNGATILGNKHTVNNFKPSINYRVKCWHHQVPKHLLQTIAVIKSLGRNSIPLLNPLEKSLGGILSLS